MARIAYIVPGFSHRTGEPAYVRIADAFRARGIEPIGIDLPWRRATIPGYIRRAREQMTATASDEVYFVGFSLGAMCVLAAAPEVQPRAQFLLSLMPLYAEDQPRSPWYMRLWTWRIYMGRPRIRYPDFNGTAPPPTTFVYGEGESRIIHPRVRAARDERFPGSRTFVADEAKHEVAHPNYLAVVERLIAEL